MQLKVKRKAKFCLRDYRQMVLRQSEKKFLFLAEKTRDIIFRLKFIPVKEIEYINPAVTRLTGYTPDELRRNINLFYKAIHPDDHHLIEKMCSPGADYSTTGTVRWIAKDGSTLWFEYSYTYITDQTGKVVAVEGIGRDITERVKMEERLIQSKRQLNNILESITDGCLAVDNNWRVTFVNRRAEEIVQKNRNEILGRVLWEVFPRAVATPLYREFQNAMSQQACSKITVYYPPLKKWVEMHIYPCESGLSFFFRDITRLKKMEKELQRSEARYKEFVDSLPQIVFEMDLNGRLTYTNRNSFVEFGYTEEDYNRGLNVLDMLVPGDRERALQNFKSLIDGAISTGNEYTMMRKDGTTFPGIINSRVIVEDNKVTGLRGFIIDITERKQAEEYFQQLFNCSPLGIVMLDNELKVMRVNSGFEILFGFRPQEAVGQYISDLIVPRDRIEEHIQMVEQFKDKTLEGETTRRRKDGRLIETHVVSYPVIINGNQVGTCVM